MGSSSLNMDEVRGSFPALAGDDVFLDNAAGSQVLGTVVQQIQDFLLHTNVQLGATYKASKKATDCYEEGYTAAARYIGATRDEIVLGPSTTQLFRIISFALDVSPGDELVLSLADHEANITPWLDLAARHSLAVRWWAPNAAACPSSPRLLPADLAPLLTPRTRLVACTHASNLLGTVHDVRAICAVARAHAPDALVCVDGVAYAPHRPVDVGELGVDLYGFSWYKVFGPHVAQVYASPRARARLRSLGHGFGKQRPQSGEEKEEKEEEEKKKTVTLEEKVGLSGASYELVAGIPAAVRYLQGKEGGGGRWDAIVQHEAELQKLLLKWLSAREDVTVWGERDGNPAERVPTISFTVRGWRSKEVVARVEAESGGRVGIRAGSFYSGRLAETVLGLDAGDGVVRVSLVHYNTAGEVQRLIALLEKILGEKN
ncbi:hypothetical protein VTJ83DRAFT_5950 [Remersonia thermophila]|uniref:Aminotransferase class V domain-containing protein n=1 Tax=Remersonia thermophila TaxID=72144 RepID=A0ABR4D8C8_9PEZI